MDKPDILLFVLALVLVFLGVLLVYGAGTNTAQRYYDNANAFLIRQGIAAGIGIACMVGLIFIPYMRIQPLTLPIVLSCLALLVLVLIPGVGHLVNNARRWISLPVLQMQPSEFAKIALVLYLAGIMSKKHEQGLEGSLRGFLPPLLITLCFVCLIYFEPDFSTAILVLIVGITLLLMGGVPMRHIIGLALSAVPFLIVLLFGRDYLRTRIFAHLDPLADPENMGYQVVQSLLSFQNGGYIGRGIGRGVQKMGALPEAHTDFILAAHAEEIGALGVSFLLLLILALVWRIFRIALRTQDNFARLFCFGIAMFIAWQTLINAGMITGLLPIAGLPFPFLSYGGSSLVANCIALGVVLNISRHEVRA
ncbi:MAG: putative lipid II flippase FtsW [Spirochaetota bacterium]|nr:putative lipid II flippase FtsW [Spirochaetota bacterium]